MSRVLLLGAGGAAGIGFTRALKQAGHEVIGTDCTDEGMLLSETDKTYPLPPAGAHGYETAFWRLTNDIRPDLIHAQPDQEVLALSRLRNTVTGRYMLPAHSVILLCQDKWRSYKRWKDVGLTVPVTQIVRGREAIHTVMRSYGPGREAWLRPRIGAGGNQSLRTGSLEMAREWMNHHRGWGDFTIASCLTENSVTCQMLWAKGELVASQQRRRLSWANAKSSPTGVTGSTGIGETCAEPDVDETATRAVLAVDDKPHGLYGVDMTYDQDGIPNPTEINVGRFFTTASEFFTRAGFNFPNLYVEVALNQTPFGSKFPIVNPLSPGRRWMRVMDREPVLA